MIDLEPEYLEIVKQILAAQVGGVEVRAFGSRVNGAAGKYSDLDLALVAAERIPLARIEALREAFAESDLPFQVDVLDWQAISASFRGVIEKKYERVQVASEANQ